MREFAVAHVVSVRAAADHRLWTRGHDLLDRIRNETLHAERKPDQLRSAQYLFEEVCAKTLYNLSWVTSAV
jgi:hypothetical protein